MLRRRVDAGAIKDPYAFLIRVDVGCTMGSMDASRNASEYYRARRPSAPVHPGSAALRRAFRQNIVSFPSQVPLFLKDPASDTQWRIVLLYFVRGWSAPKVAGRFSAPVHRIRKILNAWCVRALELGYIQVVDPEAFAICCRDDIRDTADQDTEGMFVEGEPDPMRDLQRYSDGAAMDGSALPAKTNDLLRIDSQTPSANLLDVVAIAVTYALVTNFLTGQCRVLQGLRSCGEERLSSAV